MHDAQQFTLALAQNIQAAVMGGRASRRMKPGAPPVTQPACTCLQGPGSRRTALDKRGRAGRLKARAAGPYPAAMLGPLGPSPAAAGPHCRWLCPQVAPLGYPSAQQRSLSNWPITACATLTPSFSPSSVAWRKWIPPYTRESPTSRTDCGRWVGRQQVASAPHTTCDTLAAAGARRVGLCARIASLPSGAMMPRLGCTHAARPHRTARPACLPNACVGALGQARKLGANLKRRVSAKEFRQHRARGACSGGVACSGWWNMGPVEALQVYFPALASPPCRGGGASPLGCSGCGGVASRGNQLLSV